VSIISPLIFCLSGRKHGLPRAYTLVEMLTAVSVLALMLVMMFQVIDGIFRASRRQNREMESVATGRRALDVMTIDLQNALFTGNATLLAPSSPESNLFAMLSTRRGENSAGTPRFLAVSYSLDDSNQIIRSYGPVDYQATNLFIATLQAPVNTSLPLAKGVLALQARAVTDSTNYPLSGPSSSNWASAGSYNGYTIPSGYNAILAHSEGLARGLTNCTLAIEVWIAVVDDQNYALLKSSGKLASLCASLGEDPSLWRVQVDALTIPSDIKSGVRIQKKTIPLP
jgi:type II secretory pathway component PulJ